MALKFLDELDLEPYFTALGAAHGVDSPTWGFDPGNVVNNDPSTNRNRRFIYYGAQDKILMGAMSRVDKRTTGRRTSNVPHLVDPLFLSTSLAQMTGLETVTGFPISPFGMVPGQLNPANGVQKLYMSNSSHVLFEMNLNDLTASVATTVVLDFDFSALGSGNKGYSTARERGGLVFEGLTDGIVGDANPTPASGFDGTFAIGTNVYPEGLMLCKHAASHVYGANDFNDAWGWVDLATGNLAGGTTGIKAQTLGNPTKAWQETSVGGDNFDWNHMQYIPDDDASFAQPKGRLMVWSFGARTISVADTDKIYVRFYEFNPTGKAASVGNPERTDEKILFTSSLSIEEAPIIAGGETFDSDTFDILFHPPTQRIILLQGKSATAQTIPEAGFCVVKFYSLNAAIDFVSNPNRFTPPRTADTGFHSALIRGDQNEPIAGALASWTLERISTIGEVLDAATFPGGSTVAQAVIDPDLPGSTEGSLVVYANGTPLVVTTDYTVVLSTGVITWVTDQSGVALVTCDYEHRSAPTTPAHGSLLNSTATSDADGKVVTRVKYADNDALVGELDLLTCSVDTEQ